MSTPEEPIPPVARSERRRSLGRALERFKTVLKRRSSSNKSMPPAATGSPMPQASETAPPLVTPAAPMISEPESQMPAIETSMPAPEPLLEIDTDDDGPPAVHEEPLLPMISSSTGITEEKAKVLFERYGLSYQPHKHLSPEPPSKMRRVERPIRIRIHWTCHECKASFASDRTCVSCGHRRCNDCTREPPKKVKEMLENTRQTQIADAGALPADPSIAAPEQSLTGVLLADTPSAPLETDPEAGSGDAIPAIFEYTLQLRPKGGMEMLHRPKAQLAGRVCHECNMQFLPASSADCPTCGHTKCSRCPRAPPKRDKSDLHPPTAPTVERVYRKPRQRVRYTCDQCQSVFVDRDRCRDCGHERCKTCVRNP